VLLPCAQVIHNVTEVSINLIVVLEVLIHFISFFLQPSDLHLAGSNVALQFLNLVVKHKLELFEFLSLLFELINLLLALTDSEVFGSNFGLLNLDLIVQACNYTLLVSHLHVLDLHVLLESINVLFEISELIFSQLQFSFGLETHVLNLGLILGVFVFNFIYLNCSITVYLSQSFLIILLNLSNIISKLLSCVLSSVHVTSELNKFIGNTLVMFSNNLVYVAFIVSRLLFFLCL
jgi:hypothetical protein